MQLPLFIHFVVLVSDVTFKNWWSELLENEAVSEIWEDAFKCILKL